MIEKTDEKRYDSEERKAKEVEIGMEADGEKPVIRRMCLEDIPAVAALEQKTFSEPWSENGFADALCGEQNIFLVAEIQTAIARGSLEGKKACSERVKECRQSMVGYIGLYGAFDEGDITNVAVVETCRGHGIGLALVNHMKELACKQGIRRIFLEVRASNTVAQRLYTKTGFTTCGRRPNFYRKPTEDAVLMSAEL